MTTIRPITSLPELTVLMPLFIEGYHAMCKRKNAFDVDLNGFVNTLVKVFNDYPDSQIIVLFDDDMPVGYSVGMDDTTSFGLQREMLVWALYVKPQYKGSAVVELFNYGMVEAKRLGYGTLKAFNSRFTGGMFRFYENKLGMKRHRTQFNITI